MIKKVVDWLDETFKFQLLRVQKNKQESKINNLKKGKNLMVGHAESQSSGKNAMFK